MLKIAAVAAAILATATPALTDEQIKLAGDETLSIGDWGKVAQPNRIRLQTARRSGNAWIVGDRDEHLADREGRASQGITGWRLLATRCRHRSAVSQLRTREQIDDQELVEKTHIS
jgi:hypothetical protein